jgi:hypothetical protein
MMIGTRNIPGDMLSVLVEDVADWWLEDGDSSSSWFLPRFSKALVRSVSQNNITFFLTYVFF